MNKVFGRVFAIAGAAAALATGTIGVSAQVPSDAVVFVGSATTTPAVLISGGGGTFNAATVACAGASTDDVLPVGTCSFSVTGGAYNNFICGTGQASGTAIFGAGIDSGQSFSFNIVFTALIGMVDGAGGGDSVHGAVVILPSGTPPPGACAGGFDFAGAIVAVN